jgi:2-phosphoglycerate kinase
MQPRTTCWGRKAEVAKILDLIRDSPRSALLLFGDSGIGKLTLIKEVAHMLEHKSLVSAAATAGAEGILRRILRGHAIRQRSPYCDRWITYSAKSIPSEGSGTGPY